MGQAIFSLAGELCNCTLVHITDVLNQRAAELYDVATIFIPAHIRHFLLLTLYPIRRIFKRKYTEAGASSRPPPHRAFVVPALAG
jgi:hypothetical protein